jgi:hypothetical protein
MRITVLYDAGKNLGQDADPNGLTQHELWQDLNETLSDFGLLLTLARRRFFGKLLLE